MSRGAACGPPFGMGWDVESSCGPGMVFPLGCGSSLALGCVTGQSEGRIVQAFTFGQGGGVTFYAQGGWRTAPTGKGGTGSAGGAPSGGMGSCLRRNDGGVGGWGSNDAGLVLRGHPLLILREPPPRRIFDSTIGPARAVDSRLRRTLQKRVGHLQPDRSLG